MSNADYGMGQAIWQSGDGHSALYQGESLALLASMRPESVDCIWTDPPYFLSNDGVTNVGGRRVSVNKGDWDRSDGVDEDHAFNLRWLDGMPTRPATYRNDLGNRYAAYLPQRRHGDAAARVSDSQ